MNLKTPKYNLETYKTVYEPREDSFLFLDSLEEELNFLENLQPITIAEIGSGSGVIITAIAQHFKNRCTFFATDLNPEASRATKFTSNINGTDVECLNANLLDCFKGRLFDVVLFNPPYVVTESAEMNGLGINRAWAGGKHGREVIDEVLENLDRWLSEKGVCYMVALKENKVGEIEKSMYKKGFKTYVVKERRIPGEHLYVLKFERYSLGK